MPSFLVKVKDNQAVIKVTVGDPNTLEQVNGYEALVDTGAQNTLVSSKIIHDLQLLPIGSDVIRTIGGDTISTNIYHTNVSIPIQLSSNDVVGTGFSIDVALLPFQPPNFDVLLGMDFISKFHITSWGNQILTSTVSNRKYL